MAAPAREFDLGSLRLGAGEGRRLALEVPLGSYVLGGERYSVVPDRVAATLDVSRMTGHGWSLRLRFGASLAGPCMRCLGPALPGVAVDVREVDRPGGGEELCSPYVQREVLDVAGWARDTLALALPAQVLCGQDCAGLCPVCAEDLNRAGPTHHHERVPDPRWAKLRELRLE